MPTGVYDRTKSKPNNGLFKKGEHTHPSTEFRKGEHPSSGTEFRSGSPQLQKAIINRFYMYSDAEWLEKQKLSHLGSHSSPETEIKRGQHLSPGTEYQKGQPNLFIPLGSKRPEFSGEKHPNWKGGISRLGQLLRNCPEYYEWRMLVFRRDNFICQNCGNRGGRIEAHHIKSFAQYPELRLELSNGVTLCKSCHSKGVMPNATGNNN